MKEPGFLQSDKSCFFRSFRFNVRSLPPEVVKQETGESQSSHSSLTPAGQTYQEDVEIAPLLLEGKPAVRADKAHKPRRNPAINGSTREEAIEEAPHGGTQHDQGRRVQARAPSGSRVD